jgi:UDP-N-acetylglucosamine 2-epimerase (non-hydrolysing)
MDALRSLADRLSIVFPVHPRTRQRLRDLRLDAPHPSLRFIEPVGYLDFLALQRHATLVLTDSGGVQEETTFLGVPCLTLRENTERPITVEQGTNLLVGQDMELLAKEACRILREGARPGRIPPLWDGKASERIADVIARRGVI